MNEIITLVLNYNESIERNNQTFFFKLGWKKHFQEWKKIVILTIIFVFLGFYPIKNFDTNLIFYVFRFGAIYFLIYWILIALSYIKAKRAFQIKLNQMITELRKADQNLFSIVLDDISIRIKNPFNDLSSVWDKTDYQLVENKIVITFLNTSLNFVLDKSEFINSDFEVLKKYLRQNSKEKN